MNRCFDNDSPRKPRIANRLAKALGNVLFFIPNLPSRTFSTRKTTASWCIFHETANLWITNLCNMKLWCMHRLKPIENPVASNIKIGFSDQIAKGFRVVTKRAVNKTMAEMNNLNERFYINTLSIRYKRALTFPPLTSSELKSTTWENNFMHELYKLMTFRPFSTFASSNRPQADPTRLKWYWQSNSDRSKIFWLNLIWERFEKQPLQLGAFTIDIGQPYTKLSFGLNRVSVYL